MKIDIPPERPRLDLPLGDGVTVTLSPLVESDRDLIRRGLAELSLESRFQRFGHGLSALSEKELDYLSNVDQRGHVAWGAAIDDQVAGVGRYIVSPDQRCAEVAVTVIDAMQRKGVGSALVQALVAVARADGVPELCIEVPADNEAVRGLLEEAELLPLAVGEMELRLRVADLPVGPHEQALVEVIDQVR